MKSMKAISSGLCLVAMLLVSMVAAGSASAAPVWEHCETEKGGTATKYETDQCKTAITGGTYSWQEVKGTEKVVSHASLRLADTKVNEIIATRTVAVNCSGKDEGTVGPGKFDRITEISEIQCEAGENCTKLEGNAKPLNLPWQTELVEEGGKIRDKIKAENGKGAGWAVTCEVLGVKKTDECTSEEGSVGIANVWTRGVPGELLVLGDFDKETAKATCTVGGTAAGEVSGSVALLQANGQALRVRGAGIPT